MVMFAPRILGALFMLLIGFIIAKFVAKILRKVLTKVDGLSDYINNMELFGENSIQFKLSKIVSTTVYYILLLMIWALAADILGVEAITELLQSIFAYIPNLLVAFLYLLIGIFIADIAREFLLTTLKSLGIPSASLISGFVFYFLIINILLSALTQAKINTDFIAGNISILLGGVVFAFAIGYGLASKDIAGNIISAFYWKDKFNVGDEIDVDGISGTIIAIEKSNLVVQTSNGEAFVPMSKVSKNAIIIRRKNTPQDD